MTLVTPTFKSQLTSMYLNNENVNNKYVSVMSSRVKMMICNLSYAKTLIMYETYKYD